MSFSSQEQPDPGLDGLKLEYASLKSEINSRIELRQQLISITLTFAGVILGFGVGNGTIALVYPPLALFLTIAWIQNDGRVRDAASYIRTHIEPKVPGMGWETLIEANRELTRKSNNRRPVLISHGGVFLFTQLIAVMIGLLQFGGSPVDWALLVLGVATVIMVAGMLRTYNR